MFTRQAVMPGEGFYGKIPLHWIRDHRLTGNARSVINFWASHQIGYRCTIQQTMAELGLGKAGVYAAVKLLKQLDYIVISQARGERAQFGQVDYDLGPAAFEQQYQRAWGNEPKQSMRSSPPLTDSRQAAEPDAAKPRAAKPPTKKISSKKISFVVDQEKEKTSSPTPQRNVTPSEPAGSKPGGGDLTSPNPEPQNSTETDPADALISEMTSSPRRAGDRAWSAAKMRAAIAGAEAQGTRGTLPQIIAAARRCWTDPTTVMGPGRLTHDGPWWTPSAASDPKTSAEACQTCAPFPDFRRQILIDGDPDRPIPCPDCNPRAHAYALDRIAAAKDREEQAAAAVNEAVPADLVAAVEADPDDAAAIQALLDARFGSLTT